MAVYFMSSEPSGFQTVSGHNYNTSTNVAHYDTSLSRGAITVETGVSEVYAALSGAPLTEIYFHVELYQENVVVGNYIDFKTADGTETEYRIKTKATGEWEFYRYDGTNFVLIGTTSAPMPVNSRSSVDVHILQDGVNGKVEIWKDNVNLLSFTGDTSSPQGIGQIRFIGLAGATNRMHISQIAVASTSLLNHKVQSLNIVADGTFTSWVGDYLSVDELNPNLSDFVETNTVGAQESFQLSDVNPSYSTYNVKAVSVSGIVSNDAGSAVNDNQFLVYTNSTAYTSPNLGIVKDGTNQVKSHIWETNPDTAAPWTVAEVNALETGVKAV